jgi:hypothetical protein
VAHYRAGGYLGDGFSRLAHITVAKERIGRERIVNYSISRVAAGREAVQSLPALISRMEAVLRFQRRRRDRFASLANGWTYGPRTFMNGGEMRGLYFTVALHPPNMGVR